MTASARIAALHRAAAVLTASDDDDVREIGADLMEWLMAGNGSLEEALGIGGQQGQRNWRTLAKIAKRDAALRMAAQISSLGAKALATEMARYRATAWRTDGTSQACPTRLIGTVREHLWAALKITDRALCERTIRDVLGELGNEQAGFVADDMGYDDSGKEHVA